MIVIPYSGINLSPFFPPSELLTASTATIVIIFVADIEDIRSSPNRILAERTYWVSYHYQRQRKTGVKFPKETALERRI